MKIVDLTSAGSFFDFETMLRRRGRMKKEVA